MHGKLVGTIKPHCNGNKPLSKGDDLSNSAKVSQQSIDQTNGCKTSHHGTLTLALWQNSWHH